MGIIIRQSIKGTIVSYIGSFIGFLTNFFILLKFFQPEEIGLTRVVYDSALLISGFASLGITSSAFRFFPYFRSLKNSHNGFFFYLVIIPAIGLVIFIPLYILLREPISAYFIENSALYVNYFYWIILLVVFLVFWTTFETYSNVQMRIAVPKTIREVIVRVMLMAVYLLFAFKFLNHDGLVGGIISVYGLAMALTFIYISRIGSVSLKHDYSYIEKPLRKKILNYSLFLVLTALSGSILSMLDVFMISSMKGLEYTGIYTIAIFMANVVEIPSRSISSISQPIAAQAIKEGNSSQANQLYKKVSLHQLVAGSCIFLLIWINIDNIYAIIPNGEKYTAGKWVVLFLAFTRLLNVTFNFGAILVTFSKYYHWGLFFTLFITTIGIATNLLLIPRLGITGAAIGSLLTCLLSNAIQQWIVMIKLKATPFSKGLFKFLILILAIYGLNIFLPQWSTNPYADGIYRTLIIGSIALLSVYKLKISEEINSIIDKFLFRIGRYKSEK